MPEYPPTLLGGLMAYPLPWGPPARKSLWLGEERVRPPARKSLWLGEVRGK